MSNLALLFPGEFYYYILSTLSILIWPNLPFEVPHLRNHITDLIWNSSEIISISILHWGEMDSMFLHSILAFNQLLIPAIWRRSLLENLYATATNGYVFIFISTSCFYFYFQENINSQDVFATAWNASRILECFQDITVALFLYTSMLPIFLSQFYPAVFLQLFM